MNSGAERDRMMGAPRSVRSTSMIMARTRSPVRRFSFGIISLRAGGLPPAGLDNDVALVHALDGADEDLVAARHEVVEQHLALGVADLLQDDLLGRHGADAADRHRLDRLFDVVALFDVGDRSLASISSSSASGFCRPASSGTTSQRRKVS
jgi:hypothetical protein